MSLQDLTPQLRTRLNRMEKVVGWFVFVATALLLFGFGYYIYHTAERKGWFKIKAPFHAFITSAAGLKVGDDVVLMGSPVGTITAITPMPPRDRHNVRVDFEIKEPSFRQLWSQGSFLRINSTLFGQSQLEVTRGTNGYALVVTQPVSIHPLDEAKNLMLAAPDDWQLAQDIMDANTNLLFHAYDPLESVFDPSNASLLATAYLPSNSIYIFNNQVNVKRIVASWEPGRRRYKIFTPDNDTAYLSTVEPPALGDQLAGIVGQVQVALPGIFALTNKLNAILDNAVLATSNLNTTLVLANSALGNAGPLMTNLNDITGELRVPGGPVLWALGTNGNSQIQGALMNLNSLLASTDTNVDALLINLSDITGSLSEQVRGNTNLVGGVYKTIVDVDDLVQGLKRHWLLRSAFKTNQPPARKK
jgi:ABC-type transporter Mla subunit MlaD